MNVKERISHNLVADLISGSIRYISTKKDFKLIQGTKSLAQKIASNI